MSCHYRTHNNKVYSTFKEAAISRGLLADDLEWERCIEEAILTQMPAQLRNLFCTICIFSNPGLSRTLSSIMSDFPLPWNWMARLPSYRNCLQYPIVSLLQNQLILYISPLVILFDYLLWTSNYCLIYK